MESENGEAITELPYLHYSDEVEDDSSADSPPPFGATGFGSCYVKEEDDVMTLPDTLPPLWRQSLL